MKRLTRHYYAATSLAAMLAGLILPTTLFAAAEDDLQAGIDAFNKGDLMAAMTLYRAAADAGLAEAQVKLAYILDYSEDDVGAIKLYRAAADQGHAAGFFGLGEMYSKGEGTEQDYEKAVEFFTVAANNGSLRAIALLISAYEDGELGLQADAERATYWQDRLKTESSSDDQ